MSGEFDYSSFLPTTKVFDCSGVASNHAGRAEHDLG